MEEDSKKDHLGQETILTEEEGVPYLAGPSDGYWHLVYKTGIYRRTPLTDQSTSAWRPGKRKGWVSRLVWSRRARWIFTIFAIVINLINALVVLFG